MNDSAVMRSMETGRGKRIAVLIFAALVVGVVIAIVAAGFRGRHTARSATASTTPTAGPAAQGPPLPSQPR